jgi:hypothetical protein
LQTQTDVSINDELRQVANGCAYRVKSFTGYDVNGYRFHTASYEQSWPNRRTINSGVFTPGTDGIDYYRRIEGIYELGKEFFLKKSFSFATSAMQRGTRQRNFQKKTSFFAEC